MKAQLVLQKVILNKYEEMRGKNPAFSRRAFSRKLGLSAGAMSEIFNGQRKVSLKLAEKIAGKLALDPQQRSELFALFPEKSAPSNDRTATNYLQLSADQFHIVGDWYHFAILSLMETKDFKSQPAWIAERLNITTSTAAAALERMERLEMITKDARGKYTKTETKYRTSDDIASISVRKAHMQYLAKAQEALETLPVSERDLTSLMFPLKPERLTKAKEMIREFQEKLANEFANENAKDVFQLCIQLFPLTKNLNKND